MATRAAINKQVRGFALIWTLITVIIGAATFFGIYLTYNNGLSNGDSQNQTGAISIAATLPGAQAVVLATSVPTRQPAVRATDAPTATEEKTEEQPTADASTANDSQEVAQVATEVPVPTATLLPVADTDFQVGIQVQPAFDPDSAAAWANDVSNLGLGWVKHQVRWENLELQQGQYEPNGFGQIAMALDADSAKGLKVLLSIVTTPDWAREPGVSVEEEGPPADPQTYVDFVLHLLEEFPGKIHAIEVWNEMNIDREWLSNEGLSATNYVELLRATYTAVKDVDAGIIVVSGALSPTGGFTDPQGIVRAQDDFVFLDQLIAANMLTYVDCVGVHHNGYNISPSVEWDNVPNDPSAQFRGPFDNPHHSWSFRSTLQTYANKVQQQDPEMRLCITEFGWATVEGLAEGYPTGFEFALDNTLQEQSEWTIEALNNMEEWDNVWLAFIWNLNYGAQTGWDTANDNTPYSIIGPEFAHRPVWEAIIEWSNGRRASASQ
ncbi:MAG: hypothetical protein H7Y09_15575 [Chitinophagaceae bacterium]|nr:hypothetical protein [Anaerolineae bacterium]